jgi:tetratricopeptide (TPR) repeat protein
MKKMKFYVVYVFIAALLLVVSCSPAQKSGESPGGKSGQGLPQKSADDALKLIDNKKYDESIKILDEAIKTDDKSASLFNARGRAYFGKKMYEKALEDFKKASSLNPNEPEAYVNIGNFHLVMWDIDNAKKEFEKALEKDANNVGALHGIGICYAKKLDYPTSIIWYDKVIKLDPKNSGCYDNRAYAKYYTLKFDESMSDFNKSLELNPSFSHSYFGRARIHAKNKKWSEALADLDNAIKYENDSFEAYAARGVIYADRFDYTKALSDLDFALKLKPDSTIAHYERGKVYVWMGKFDKAMSDFNIAQQAKTKVYTFSVREVDISGPVMLAKGITSYMTGTNDEAVKQEIKKGIEKTEKLDNPFDSENCNIGFGYYILGDNKKAIENFDTAIKTDPELYQAYYGRALAYIKSGKKSDAIGDLVVAAKKLPNIWLKQKSLEILKNQGYDIKTL